MPPAHSLRETEVTTNMMVIIVNGHEYTPGEPCRWCGMTKREIFATPHQQCVGAPLAIIAKRAAGRAGKRD